mmetsp:Transcript_38781/g.64487  ORF Transcript_38781/g.64487 Transcript_38781/m.64487 type:complete len:144 (+) Transcript_38781:49-480(+)
MEDDEEQGTRCSILFCDECQAVLIPRIDSEGRGLHYACSNEGVNCSFKKVDLEPRDYSVFSVSYKDKERRFQAPQSFRELIFDPTLPLDTTNVCKYCKKNDNVQFCKQSRDRAVGIHVFFICKNCQTIEEQVNEQKTTNDSAQ